MDTVSLSGKELAAAINADTKERAAALTASGTAPRLALIVANDDPASAWYVNSLRKAAERLGIACDTIDLGADASIQRIRDELTARSADAGVDAIMLQTPCPLVSPSTMSARPSPPPRTSTASAHCRSDCSPPAWKASFPPPPKRSSNY